MSEEIEYRVCSKCGERKELCKENFRFSKNKQNFGVECKSCIKKYNKQYYNKTHNSEKITNKNIVERNRKCTACGVIKELCEENFYIYKTGRQIGKWNTQCKMCLNKKNRDNGKKHSKKQDINKDVPQGMGKCIVCNEIKKLCSDNFSLRKGRKNWDSRCKSCKNNASREEYKKRNPPKEKSLVAEGMRRCNKCCEIKPLNQENFGKRKGKWRFVCKICLNKENKLYRENQKTQPKIIYDVPNIIEYGLCNKCGENKLLCEENFLFLRNKNKWNTECKICKKEYNRKYREQHPYIKVTPKIPEYRVCYLCGEIKELCNKNYSYSKYHKKWQEICRICRKEMLSICKTHEEKLQYAKKYREANRATIIVYLRNYYKNNKLKRKEYIKNNKEVMNRKRRVVYHNNIELMREKARLRRVKNGYKRGPMIKRTPEERSARRSQYLKTYNVRYKRERMLTDPAFKLRNNFSKFIHLMLRRNNHKNYTETTEVQSILKYLPYTMIELKKHIEDQFEWWMTWENWGLYRKDAWNDNDPSTWKWQIDHIIPNSFFKYASMDDPEFLKCWALENLRPYSAKQNLIDGNRRPIEKVAA